MQRLGEQFPSTAPLKQILAWVAKEWKARDNRSKACCPAQPYRCWAPAQRLQKSDASVHKSQLKGPRHTSTIPIVNLCEDVGLHA